ncbi:two-component sensor histidine kinase [Aerophototrophica crusticola]|uniref:histidine kinase n=1 Tax=Aerophototrophica crusticola TaxID=1709002 RepID=A0A858RA44_9PROT|nr:two-component sensor histidine kinase [Rhodospirillaceae bacterium B3]
MLTVATGPGFAQAYLAALAAAALASLALAGLLAWRARHVPVWGVLALFLLGVAGWSVGMALPALLGPAADPWASLLVALSPLPSAAFVHLVFAFVRCGALTPVARAAYAAGAVAALGGVVLDTGSVEPWRGFPGMFVPSLAGWAVMGTSAALSVLGHLRLAQGWWQAEGLRRRQAGAVLLSSAVGLASLTGFLFPALGVPADPWPVLLLPAYSLVMVYGILRYQFMDVNLWARRLVAWGLLSLVLAAGSALVAALPLALGTGLASPGFWERWALLALTLLLALAILSPLQRLATRLVFPGGAVTAADQAAWAAALGRARDWPGLLETARTLLSARLGTAVAVVKGDASSPIPTLSLSQAEGGWSVSLQGWQDAPPGPLHVAGLFGACLSAAAGRLDQALALAAQERERQRQERLAELGQLAATVAHDLRNPLNIIAMAAAGAAPDVRAEVAAQVARMEHLVADILDYARGGTLSPRTVDLRDLADQAAQGLAGPRPDIAIPPGTLARVDPRRLAQALANLLANAAAHGSRVAVYAERDPAGGLSLHVCDDGPGIPAEIRDSLFRPFVSRRPGGTGLGLAIVARIAEAHGGTASLTDRPGWSTCITLALPAEAATP